MSVVKRSWLRIFDLVRHVGFLDRVGRLFHPLWIDVDPDGGCAELLSGGRDDDAVPAPRSYTTSLAETSPTFNMASTTSGGVGTKMTSGVLRGGACAACCA